MKTLKELAQELEAIAGRIKAEPLAGERIRLCGSVRYLSDQMHAACAAERLVPANPGNVAAFSRPEGVSALPLRPSGFFGLAVEICDVRRHNAALGLSGGK